MLAAVYTQFQQPLTIETVPDPRQSDDGVVLAVEACGICRSDWHGWMGNDPDIVLPHVPGHELAGIVESVGANVSRFAVGDRVTLPFVCGCGECAQCTSGNQQVCDRQFQPGFTAWGGFAEFVAIDHADANLVRLPADISFVTASSLGCRFITSFRAVKDQGKVEPGHHVAIWGCGGVGLSAIMIAKALGANVVAIDIDDAKLAFARSVGADAAVNSTSVPDVVAAVTDLTGGGANVSIEALGHPQLVHDSVASLRKHGKHIQVGIMESGLHQTPVPMDLVIGRELEILGSHGMQAHKYPEMFEMIADGRLNPGRLIGNQVTLGEGAKVLTEMNSFSGTGVTVISTF
ncbi:MAG TPA: zinc-dependent alcohol dehydrogenase family protein [Pyrinomonadaceae bacterium]|nr:zinc-dependent alcohol dehydrogenase family protein [Pyrinomonadaceae bacterium]